MTGRRRTPRLAGAFLLLFAAATVRAADEPTTWQLRLRTDRHSDFGTLADIDSDDAARFRARGSRNLAYLDDEVRVERRSGGWHLALLARSTATLTASRGAIEAWRHARRVERDGADHHWDIQGHLRGFTGGGVEAGLRLRLAPEWRAVVHAQALVLTRWRDRRIEGVADFDAASAEYSFDLASLEVNDRRSFPFQRGFAARGAGLLFGGELRWQRGDLAVAGQLRDLGWLHWRDVPQQDMTLVTDTRSVDAEGFLVYRPLVQGRNTQRRLVRAAPWRASLAGRWQATAADELVLAGEFVRDFGVLPSLAWERGWRPDLRTEVRFQLHEQRLTLGAQWGHWRLRFGADRLGAQPHSRTVELGYVREL